MKIAVLDDYFGYSERFAQWGELAAEVTVFRDPIPKEALSETLAPFEVLCVMRERTPLPAELIQTLPNLQLIVTTGMRNASIDIEAAAARGIPVCGTASRLVASSHLAMTLILVAMRNLVPNLTSVARGNWQSEAGRDLEGLTLGVIGLGRIGTDLVKLARPFGMKIVAWSQNLTDARCAEVGVTRADSLSTLLEQADVSSIHLVLSDRTKGLIGAEELARMKPDACLVNTSRGPIIDRDALLTALRSRQLGIAALDVFEDEPLPKQSPWRDNNLIESGQLILTPHMGYGTLATYQRMYSETAEDVRAFFGGAPLRVISV